MSQYSKNYQIEFVEIGNFLNFEMNDMFRQAANDIFYKTFTSISLCCQPEPIEGGVSYSNGFERLLMTSFIE